MGYESAMRTRTLTLVFLATGSLFLSACNTTIGVSRDIRALGAGMENVSTGRNFDGQPRPDTPPNAPPPAAP